MSLRDNFVTCSYCNNRFQSSVVLPCNEINRNETDCLHHAKSLSCEKSLECFNGEKNHATPISAFPSDKKAEQNFGLQTSNEKVLFTKLTNLYKKYAELNQNPLYFVHSHFDNIKKMIIEYRDQNKKIIDDLFEEYLQEMSQIELGYVEKIDQILKTDLINDESNSTRFWQSKIEKLSQDLQEKCYNDLKSEIFNLENKLEEKIYQLEQNVMPKNLTFFKGKLLESIQLGHFERKKYSHDEPVASELVNKNSILCLAMNDFEAQNSEELSFRKGDIMVIMSNSQKLWLARINDRTGYVNPKVLAEIWDEEWFVGRMDRDEAERLFIKKTNEPGFFLVRLSIPAKDGQIYSLSVRNKDDSLKHYRIFRELNSNGFWNYWLSGSKCKFDSIKILVEYYMKKCGGLCTELTSPCCKS